MSEGEGKPFVFCIIAMGIAESVGMLALILMLILAP
jgi:F0F1-type ATP synthase membrane subunit c/vacuolar-type H+-ATPase subunit K